MELNTVCCEGTGIYGCYIPVELSLVMVPAVMARGTSFRTRRSVDHGTRVLTALG